MHGDVPRTSRRNEMLGSINGLRARYQFYRVRCFYVFIHYLLVHLFNQSLYYTLLPREKDEGSLKIYNDFMEECTSFTVHG